MEADADLGSREDSFLRTEGMEWVLSVSERGAHSGKSLGDEGGGGTTSEKGWRTGLTFYQDKHLLRGGGVPRRGTLRYALQVLSVRR